MTEGKERRDGGAEELRPSASRLRAGRLPCEDGVLLLLLFPLLFLCCCCSCSSSSPPRGSVLPPNSPPPPPPPPPRAPSHHSARVPASLSRLAVGTQMADQAPHRERSASTECAASACSRGALRCIPTRARGCCTILILVTTVYILIFCAWRGHSARRLAQRGGHWTACLSRRRARGRGFESS